MPLAFRMTVPEKVPEVIASTTRMPLVSVDVESVTPLVVTVVASDWPLTMLDVEVTVSVEDDVPEEVTVRVWLVREAVNDPVTVSVEDDVITPVTVSAVPDPVRAMVVLSVRVVVAS